MFILQAADSFTMIHYLEYYSTHTSGHCGGAAAALPHHAARLLPLYLHFAQAATTIYWLAHHSAAPPARRARTTEVYCSDELTNTAACA